MFSLFRRNRVIPTPESRQPFYLMQRVLHDETSGDSLLGAGFSLDYMGAAEFEHGAIPESLKRLQSARKQLTIGGVARDFREVNKLIYILCNRDNYQSVTASFVEWFGAEREDSKRNSGLRQEYAKFTFDEANKDGNIAAWWALRADAILSFDLEVLETIKDRIESKK